MNINDLRKAIENLPDDMPVFFRRISPFAGNIERAGHAIKSTYSSFGVLHDCLIVEPYEDDEQSAPMLVSDCTVETVVGFCKCGTSIEHHTGMGCLYRSAIEKDAPETLTDIPRPWSTDEMDKA